VMDKQTLAENCKLEMDPAHGRSYIRKSLCP
jgi:hypothetical protein